MANGDAAAAAGMDVVPGTADLRKGYDEDNKTRDYLAGHMTDGTHDASAITSGVLAEARIPAIPGSKVEGAVSLRGASAFDAISVGGSGADIAIHASGAIHALGAVQAFGEVNVGGTLHALGAVQTSGEVNVGGALRTPHGRANVVTSWIAAGIGPDGRIGVSGSARRFKTDIEPLVIPPDLFMKIEAVTYRMIADGENGRHYVGVIAEQLIEAGLAQFVHFDEDGEPFSVAYELLWLASIATARNHEDRIRKLEGDHRG